MTLEEKLEWRQKEGYAEGHSEAQIEVARNMKKDGVELELICKYTGLSESDIKIL